MTTDTDAPTHIAVFDIDGKLALQPVSGKGKQLFDSTEEGMRMAISYIKNTNISSIYLDPKKGKTEVLSNMLDAASIPHKPIPPIFSNKPVAIQWLMLFIAIFVMIFISKNAGIFFIGLYFGMAMYTGKLWLKSKFKGNVTVGGLKARIIGGLAFMFCMYAAFFMPLP